MAQTLIYEGPPSGVSALAQTLRERRVYVTYDAPEETAGVEVHDVRVYLFCEGGLDAMRIGVENFLSSRFGPDVRVRPTDG